MLEIEGVIYETSQYDSEITGVYFIWADKTLNNILSFFFFKYEILFYLFKQLILFDPLSHLP